MSISEEGHSGSDWSRDAHLLPHIWANQCEESPRTAALARLDAKWVVCRHAVYSQTAMMKGTRVPLPGIARCGYSGEAENRVSEVFCVVNYERIDQLANIERIGWYSTAVCEYGQRLNQYGKRCRALRIKRQLLTFEADTGFR